MFSIRRASPVFHFRHFQALSLNLIDGRYQCLSIKVGIHTLGERHGAGMPHDLLDHRLIYMSLRQHRDTCMPGVVRLMEANLAKLEQQEQKYTAELNAALAEYNGLKAQAVGFDPDELAMAQLEIRPQKEASAESRVQATYGDKYDFWTMIGEKREVEKTLGEEEPRSIIERMRRKEREKERINLARQPERKKQKDRGWER